MNLKIKIFFTSILLFSTFLVATSEGSEEHHFDWGGFWGWVLNSTILFGGLILLLRKPFIKLLSQKSLDIKNDIIDREKNLKLTSEQFEKIKKRLDKIEEEVQEMQKVAKRDGEKEMIKIEELGKKESQRILSLTEMEIKNRVESSITNLKEKIAQLSIDHFKKDIKSQLDEKKHRNIIDKNIKISGDILDEKNQPESNK